jgi:hypothetical protein
MLAEAVGDVAEIAYERARARKALMCVIARAP